MPQSASLSTELRSLVKRAVSLLGEVIREELGAPAYQRIEALRSRMTAVRGLGEQHEASYTILRDELLALERLSRRERIELALAFTLMLELMNACENAYRTWRLRAQPPHPSNSARPHAIIYVLTAHPTESRSPETIAVFREILQALVGWLDAPASRALELRLRNLLKLAWRLSPSRTRKPSVRNEAEAIFSMVLQGEALESLIAANRELCSVYLRTWVGGDKDGHPGVDEKTLQQSLAASRARLLRHFESGLSRVRALSERVRDAQLGRELRGVAEAAAALRQLTPGDGGRVARLRARLKGLRDVHPAVSELRLLLRVFPGLVIPLELRESSEILLEAAGGEPRAISRMVRRVRELSRGGDAKWYARGLIISMASTIEQVRAGCALVRRELGALNLPVIPLLEQGAALEGGTQLVEAMLREPQIEQALRGSWAGLLEVMVGYSDSAKEMGVLQSRLSIARAIHAIDRLPVFREGLARPLFFHGSGGSTDRGGGSIEEQTAWWPESALVNYKATIQGETIERTFASPEIARRRLEQIAARVSGEALVGSLSSPGSASPSPASLVESGSRRSKVPASPAAVRAEPYAPHPALERFAAQVSRAYREKIAEPDFLEVTSRATGYRYLSDLKLGSRPAKRGKVLSVQALRAIPWVMCWTQTRVLLPTWWGVGSAWKELARAERTALQEALASDALFGSFVKVLSSTLARVELPVFQLYLERSGIDPLLARRTIEELRSEHDAALRCVRELTGARDLLWFKPWLGTSIRLRAPMIHPLNLLQVLTLREPDPALTRVTVTGIAAGMLTTG